ncbi:MAG: type II toxin-antitoxin system VapC family toxin [Methylococcaceae bacterium]|nr:type II toxin-antitoxin system VapC family toxin [Methylococcaceae bacterium]
MKTGEDVQAWLHDAEQLLNERLKLGPIGGLPHQSDISMFAEKLTLRTDSQGNIIGLPLLSPNGRGTLKLPFPLPYWFEWTLNDAGIISLPVTHASVELPPIHKDPADCIIIATAQHHGAWLVTRDESIQKYPNLHAVWNFAPERQ